MAKEYVLVSQGIEIDRTRSIERAIQIRDKSNKDFYKYKQRCLDNFEPYADNEVFLYVEDGEEVSLIK